MMVTIVFWAIVVVVIRMPDRIVMQVHGHHRTMLRRHMPDGKEPAEQETKSYDAPCVQHRSDLWQTNTEASRSRIPAPFDILAKACCSTTKSRLLAETFTEKASNSPPSGAGVTGAERWTSGESFGKYWSLVANGDRMLALDERGILYLLRATPEKYDKLDERKVSADGTWAHLAVCGDELFIRELNAITAWRWKVAR